MHKASLKEEIRAYLPCHVIRPSIQTHTLQPLKNLCFIISLVYSLYLNELFDPSIHSAFLFPGNSLVRQGLEEKTIKSKVNLF